MMAQTVPAVTKRYAPYTSQRNKNKVIAINRSKCRDQNPSLYANSIGVDGRIILRWIFRKWNVRAWTGSIWLRKGTGGGNMCMR
jgi:hypothetical protein